MPCRHEGGTDPCFRNTQNKCAAQKRIYGRAAYIRDKDKRVQRQREYNARKSAEQSAAHKEWHRINKVRSNLGCNAKNADRGTASELFVKSELLRRGLLVGEPVNRFAKHDAFVKLSGKWVTVQIKTAVMFKNGHMAIQKAKSITSDVIALVNLNEHQIRWISNTAKPVPRELAMWSI